MSIDNEKNVGQSDDGEIDFNAFVVGSHSTTQLVDQFQISEQNRKKQLADLMKHLEKSNPKGLPRLYATLGEGEERSVILTIPYLEPIISEMNASPRFNINYWGLSNTRFFVAQFLDYSLSERGIEELQDSLRVEEVWTSMLFLDPFHNYIRQKTLRKSLRELTSGCGKCFTLKEIEPSKAVSMFEDIQTIIKGRYQGVISKDNENIFATQSLKKEMTQKPKRKFFGR